MAGTSAAERSAWRSYLKSTVALRADRYEQIEPWAWGRLQDALRKIVVETGRTQ